MSDLPRLPLRLSDLAARRPTPVTLEPDAAGRAALAEALGIPAIRKLRFSGTLTPLGRQDWELRADLGATVVQDCVVTLAPVTTRIDATVTRRYLADYVEPGGTEAEMPEDDEAEPLPQTLDLGQVLREALALELPPFPRAEGAALDEAQFAAPGVSPMTDDDAKPLAGLAALKAKLESRDD